MERPLVADRALPGQRARRPRQPPDGRPDHAGGLQGRGRSGDVSRADRGRAAAVAAAEAVHGRRARERGLDAARRSRRLQPVARRLATRTSRAPASASSARRTAAASIRSRARRTATTSGWRRRSTRRERRRASSTASTPRIPGMFATLRHARPRRAPRRCWRDRARGGRGRRRRSRWTIRPPPCPRWRAASPPRATRWPAARRAIRTPSFLLELKEQQFAGRDQHRARHRLHRRRAARRRRRAHRPVRGLRAAADDGRRSFRARRSTSRASSPTAAAVEIVAGEHRARSPATGSASSRRAARCGHAEGERDRVAAHSR